MAEAEKHCLKELKNFRVDPNREFFKGNEKEIINTVRKVISNYKSLPADVFPKYPETNPETKKISYELEEQVKKIGVDHLGIDESKITLDSKFIEDLGADSLDTVELVMAFEENFNIEIPDDAAGTIATVQDAINYIETKK
jgi:acyl carrier protein